MYHPSLRRSDGAVVAPIHNRVPVTLLPEDEDRWLDPELTDPGEIASLLRPYPAELMAAQPMDSSLVV